MKLWKIFLLILVICMTILAIYNALTRDVPVALGFLSVGFAILSILFAIRSIEIGNESTRIAKESDKKMMTVAEDTFLAIAGVLEDRRLDLKNKRLQYKHLESIINHTELIEYQLAKIEYINILSFSIWKCYTDLQRIELFKDYMKKNERLEGKQNKIIKYLKLYYDELIIGKNLLKMQISGEYKEHIKEMFNIVGDFKIYPISPFNNDLYELMLKLQKDK